jgi:RNA polymerase sigma factor (sigma-70 family)
LQDWLTRIRASDDSAWEELLRQFSGRLERLARNMLHRFPNVQSHAEAEDILQNALVRLLHALREVKPASTQAFFGLVAEQMRRELLDLARHFKRPQHIQRYLVDAWSENPQGEANAGLLASIDEPEDLEGWCRFHEEIERLPVLEREVVGLIYYHGWTQARVAELFHVNERTVRRHWEAALAHLRGILKDEPR